MKMIKGLIVCPTLSRFRWRGHTADVISSGRRDPSHCLAGLSDEVGVSLDKSASNGADAD